MPKSDKRGVFQTAFTYPCIQDTFRFFCLPPNFSLRGIPLSPTGIFRAFLTVIPDRTVELLACFAPVFLRNPAARPFSPGLPPGSEPPTRTQLSLSAWLFFFVAPPFSPLWGVRSLCCRKPGLANSSPPSRGSDDSLSFSIPASPTQQHRFSCSP